MTTIEIEHKITAAFQGGERRTRELRLTEDEAAYIRAQYSAVITPLGQGGEKDWYEITFRGAEH